MASAIVGGLFAPAAAADEYDALNLVAGVNVSYESNLFARPDFLNPQSDTLTQAYVGLRFDKPYAQQRIQLDAMGNAYRYNEFSNLDFDGFDYRGAWLWHLSPRVNGTLSAARTEVPTVFENTIGTGRNVLTTETYVFDLDGQISGGWHGLLGYTNLTQSYEQVQATAIPSFTADISLIGLKYLFASGNWINAVYRWINGEYKDTLPNFVTAIGSGFDGYDGEIGLNWAPTGTSVLSGRVTYLDRRDDTFPQRDFSGTAGELNYRWFPTGKLRIWLGARRDISAYQTNLSSYRVDDRVWIEPSWQVSTKVAIRLALYRGEIDYLGPVVVTTIPQRHDVYDGAQLGVRWTPTRGSMIGATVEQRRRTSNDPFSEYDNTVASVRVELTF